MHGAPNTGKTTLVRTIVRDYIKYHMKAQLVVITCVAATADEGTRSLSFWRYQSDAEMLSNTVLAPYTNISHYSTPEYRQVPTNHSHIWTNTEDEREIAWPGTVHNAWNKYGSNSVCSYFYHKQSHYTFTTSLLIFNTNIIDYWYGVVTIQCMMHAASDLHYWQDSTASYRTLTILNLLVA